MNEVVYEGIIRFLESKFEKDSSELTQDDFNLVTELPINGNNIDVGTIDLKEILSLFPNLVSISFSKYNFTSEDIKFLKSFKLVRLSFLKCSFEDISSLSDIELKTLILNKCKINSLEFLKDGFENIESLLIRAVDKESLKIDCSWISSKKNLIQLTLENLIIRNFMLIKEFPKLQYISILGANFFDNELQVLSTLPSLMKLYIDSDFNNAEELSTLSKNVSVRNNFFDEMFLPETNETEEQEERTK